MDEQSDRQNKTFNVDRIQTRCLLYAQGFAGWVEGVSTDTAAVETNAYIIKQWQV